MALIPATAHLRISRPEWRAAERRARDEAEARDRDRMDSDKRMAQLLQRLDMASRLHWVTTPEDPGLHIASRWDLVAFLNPRKSERAGQVAHHADGTVEKQW